MESIGQILKAARERRQISMDDVAVATKMTSTFVKAIEADNFDALVAPVYARGFIKLYAECVGLDPMPLQKQFDVSSRAVPALAPPPSKAPPMKASVAYAGKQKSPHLQQSGSLTRNGATGKPAPISKQPTSPAVGKRSLAAESSGVTPAWSVSLLAGQLSALNRMFVARVQWPRFKLPNRLACNAVRSTAGRVLPYISLPVIVWRRIFIVTSVVLLIIAASLAWEWSHRGTPSTTDACRWLAEPPAPYLAVEVRPASPGR